MALPEHKYYTLQQAAKKVGCEVEDLIHFAAIGVLELCIKIPASGAFYSHLKDEGKLEGQGAKAISIESFSFINGPGVKLLTERIKSFPETIQAGDIELVAVETVAAHRRYFYKSEYFQIIEYYDQIKGCKGIEKWSGMLAIPSIWIKDIEDPLVNDLNTPIFFDVLSAPRAINPEHHELYELGDFHLGDWYAATGHELFITNYEIKILLDGGRKTTAVGSRRGIKMLPLEPQSTGREKISNPSKKKISLIELSFVVDGEMLNLQMEPPSGQLQPSASISDKAKITSRSKKR